MDNRPTNRKLDSSQASAINSGIPYFIKFFSGNNRCIEAFSPDLCVKFINGWDWTYFYDITIEVILNLYCPVCKDFHLSKRKAIILQIYFIKIYHRHIIGFIFHK